METTVDEQFHTIIGLCIFILLFGLKATLLLTAIAYFGLKAVAEFKKLRTGFYEKPWFGMLGARA